MQQGDSSKFPGEILEILLKDCYISWRLLPTLCTVCKSFRSVIYNSTKIYPQIDNGINANNTQSTKTSRQLFIEAYTSSLKQKYLQYQDAKGENNQVHSTTAMANQLAVLHQIGRMMLVKDYKRINYNLSGTVNYYQSLLLSRFDALLGRYEGMHNSSNATTNVDEASVKENITKHLQSTAQAICILPDGHSALMEACETLTIERMQSMHSFASLHNQQSQLGSAKNIQDTLEQFWLQFLPLFETLVLRTCSEIVPQEHRRQFCIYLTERVVAVIMVPVLVPCLKELRKAKDFTQFLNALSTAIRQSTGAIDNALRVANGGEGNNGNVTRQRFLNSLFGSMAKEYVDLEIQGYRSYCSTNATVSLQTLHSNQMQPSPIGGALVKSKSIDALQQQKPNVTTELNEVEMKHVRHYFMASPLLCTVPVL